MAFTGASKPTQIKIVATYDDSQVQAGTGRTERALRSLEIKGKGLDASSLRQIAGAFDATGASASRAAPQVEGLMDLIAGQVGGLATGAGIAALANYTVQLSELGSRSIQARSALTALSGGAADAQRNIAAIQAVTNGSVSELQAMQSASQILSLGLASNSQQLGEFVRVASLLGAGKFSPAESIDQLASAIANVSYERLDQLGISSSAVRARIEELKASTQGLTTEQAFLQAVMEQGTAKANALAAAGVVAGTGMDQFRAATSNLAAELGENLAPKINGVAEDLSTVLTGAMAFAESQGISLAENAVGALESGLGSLIPGIDSTSAAMGWLADQMRDTEVATVAATQATLDYNQPLTLVEFQAGLAAEANLLLADAERKVGADAYIGIQGLNALLVAIEGTGDAADRARSKIAFMVSQANAAASKYPEYFGKGAQPDVALARFGMEGGNTSRAGGGDVERAETRIRDDYNRQWYATYQQQQRDATAAANKAARANESASKKAASAWEREQKKAAAEAEREQERAAKEAQRAWENAVNDIRGAVRGSIDLSTDVSAEDTILGSLRPDAVNEMGRRLADIRDRALEGKESPWLSLFPELQGGDKETLAARAQQIMNDISAGLRTDLLNKDAILANAKRSIEGQRATDALVEELTQELVGQGYAIAEVGEALGATMGVSIGDGAAAAGTVSTIVSSIKTEADAKQGELQSVGRRIVEYMKAGMLSGITDLGIITAIVRQVLGELEEAATAA